MSLKYSWFLCLLIFAACKEEKPKLVSDEHLTVADFISIAPQLATPVVINDSVVNRKESDSAKIHLAAFKTFIPDSVFKSYFPQEKQLKLFLVGKSTDNQKGNYLFVKSVAGNKRAVHLLYYTSKAQFLGGMKVADNIPKAGINKYCKIDSRYNISMIQEQKTPTGEYWTAETIYYMDATGKMIIAMTNNTQDRSNQIMGNPIDTFPRKNKFSADYSIDKNNLVSVRDGATAKQFRFFIHFSKQNGSCNGELKGDGEWVGNGKGVFRDINSPCVIQFSFTGGSVSIKEETGCGSYRDITCFFEGNYARKKESAKKKTGTKKK